MMLLAAVLVTAWLLYDPDRNVIDEEFVQSESYKSLQQQLEDEKTEFRKRESVVNLVIQRMYDDTLELQQSLPVRLDSLSLDTLLVEKYKIPIYRDEVSSSEFTAFSFYRLQRFNIGDLTTMLFFMERPGVYRNVGLVLATVKDSEVVDTELIGEYKKNISEEVKGIVAMKGNSIFKSTLTRTRFYPVVQKNVVAYRYIIAKDGTIESQVISDS